jgi:hypothetical protein
MRAWPVAFVALVLAGCVGDGIPPSPLSASRSTDAGAAPRHEAGQWWEWDVQARAEVRTPEVEKPTVRDEQEVHRTHVLATGLETRFGPLSLYLNEGDFSYLSAGGARNLTMYFLEAWTAPACPEADICVPPLAADVRDVSPLGLEFPLRAGQRWHDSDGRDGRTTDVEVVGATTVATAAGTFPAVHVRMQSRMEGAPSGFAFEFKSDVDVYYSGQVGHFVRWAGTVELRSVDVRGDEVREQHTVLTLDAELAGHGRGEPMDLADAVSLLELEGPEPRVATTPASVKILEDNEDFAVGDAWTFHALASGEGEVSWSLLRSGPWGDGATLASGEGPTFDVAFTSPGLLTVEARMHDADGRLAAYDVHEITVRQTLEGTGSCRLAVAPVGMEDPTVCDGFQFPLPPGLFAVRATATFPLEQSALPCPALVLYEDGEEAARDYAWVTSGAWWIAEVEGVAAGDQGAVWEARWQPSASRGGTVDYTIEIEPVGSGSFEVAGGSGC